MSHDVQTSTKGNNDEKHSPVNGEQENTSQEKMRRFTVKNIDARFSNMRDSSEIPCTD